MYASARARGARVQLQPVARVIAEAGLPGSGAALADLLHGGSAAVSIAGVSVGVYVHAEGRACGGRWFVVTRGAREFWDAGMKVFASRLVVGVCLRARWGVVGKSFGGVVRMSGVYSADERCTDMELRSL